MPKIRGNGGVLLARGLLIGAACLAWLGQAAPTLAEQPEPIDVTREAVRALQYGSEDEAVVALRKLVSCHSQDGASDPIHEAVRQIQYGDTNEAALALKRLLGGPSDDSQTNPFDGCVLDHMRNVEFDFAAKSIKQACVRMAEKDLPVKNKRSQIFGNLGGGNISFKNFGKLEKAFYIRFQNQSDYSISNIIVRLWNDTQDLTFTLQRFLFISWIGQVISAPPPDPTYDMILGPGYQGIYFSLEDTPFANNPNGLKWDIVSAKGWH